MKDIFVLFIELIFWSGVISSFMRTSDLFQMFAPSQFFGYSTVGWYGILCALSVESLLLIAKYYNLIDPTAQNTKAKEFSIRAGMAAWALSFLAQGIDGYMVREQLDTLPAIVKDVIYWIVPNTPLIVSGALIVFSGYLQSVKDATHISKPSAGDEFNRIIGNAKKILTNATGGGAKPTQPPRKPSPIVQGVETETPKAEAPNNGAKG